MPISLRLQQHPTQIVSLDGWEPDEEFPYGPQGAKPKRIFICPNLPPYSFLIGGHRYLFKEPGASRAQQIWSEVIAYELSRDLRLPVPPAFLALGPGNGSPGVLIEFFYGHAFDPRDRFVHAIEQLQGLPFPIDFKRGSLKDNTTLCRLLQVPDWRAWWARTLAFDAVIGNSDRHSENWGFLIDSASPQPTFSLAPAFDNGTSLGYIIRENDLPRFTRPEALGQLVARGRHHYGWVSGDHEGAQHARLCRRFIDRYPTFSGAMDDAVSLMNARIDQIVEWCTKFPYPVPFTTARAFFVAALLRARRDSLAACLET